MEEKMVKRKSLNVEVPHNSNFDRDFEDHIPIAKRICLNKMIKAKLQKIINVHFYSVWLMIIHGTDCVGF